MKPYASIILAGLLGLTLAYQAVMHLARNAGELESVAETVVVQGVNDGLYMGLTLSPADYKLEAYRVRRPDVLVLGSSRAMLFDQALFRRRIYNFGGLIYSPEQARALLRLALATHPPQVVIYAMDVWSFCALPDDDAAKEPEIPQHFGWPGWTGGINRFRLLADLMVEGRLSPGQAWDLFSGAISPWHGGAYLQGITALLKGQGFGVDGALYLVDGARAVVGDDGRPDWYPTVRNMIVNGAGQFPLHCRLHRGRITALAHLIDDARAMGIALVLVAPPLPGETIDLMAATPGSGEYVTEWFAALDSLKYPDLMIAHDGRMLGSLTSEFGDGFHGGSVTYARLLRRMSEQSSAVAAIANLPTIDRMIAIYAGRPVLSVAEMRGLAAGP